MPKMTPEEVKQINDQVFAELEKETLDPGCLCRRIEACRRIQEHINIRTLKHQWDRMDVNQKQMMLHFKNEPYTATLSTKPCC